MTRDPIAPARHDDDLGKLGQPRSAAIVAPALACGVADRGPGEQWAWIPGYEGLYEVSDQGSVFSYPRYKCRGGEIQAAPDTYGYMQVSISREGVQRTVGIHRLVLLAFAGPRPEGTEIRHLNGDKLDNRLVNLCYGTRSENQLDRVRHGRHDTKGSRNPRAKLTATAVREIRGRFAAGEPIAALAREFGLGWTTVSMVVRRETWRHVA